MDDVLFFLSGVVIGTVFKKSIVRGTLNAVNRAINAYVDAGLPGFSSTESKVKTEVAVHEKYREYMIDGQIFYRIITPIELELQDIYVPLKNIGFRGKATDEEALSVIIRRAAGYNGDFHGHAPTLAELADVFSVDTSGLQKIIVVNDCEEEFIIA